MKNIKSTKKNIIYKNTDLTNAKCIKEMEKIGVTKKIWLYY